MICEYVNEQPYNNDVRYGMSIWFSLNTRPCLLNNVVFSVRGYHRYFNLIVFSMKQFEIVYLSCLDILDKLSQNFTAIALITFHHLCLIIFFLSNKDHIRTGSLKLCWESLQKRRKVT